MFAIERTFTFSAAHRLPRHTEKCGRLHGHNFVCTLRLEGPTLQAAGSQSGMLMDFEDVAAAMSSTLAEVLDHCDLNETTRLPNPTSEELARWLCDRLRPALPLLVSVRVAETPSVCAEYRP